MSGFWLKVIACICMLIDHIAQICDIDSYNMPLYLSMKYVGRIAFVIFAFLIVEGYRKTSNINKYLIRLGAFAFISEIPFDMAFNDSYLDFDSQNVFFTLFLGVLAILLFEAFEKNLMLASFCGMSVGLLALYMNTDYKAMGVWLILFLFVFRDEKGKQFIAGASVIVLYVLCDFIDLIERYDTYEAMINWKMLTNSCTRLEAYMLIFRNLFGIVGLLFIWLYNEERGYNAKWVKYGFYIFYPLHILIIYFIHIYC